MDAIMKSGVKIAVKDSKNERKTNLTPIAVMIPNVDRRGKTLPSYEILKVGMHYFCLRIGTVLKDSLQKISQQLLQSTTHIETRKLTERRGNLRGLNDNYIDCYDMGIISPTPKILDNSFENMKGQNFDNFEYDKNSYILSTSASSSINNENDNNNHNYDESNTHYILEDDKEKNNDVTSTLSNFIKKIENEGDEDRLNNISYSDHENAVNDHDDFFVLSSNFSTQSYSIIVSEPENTKIESNNLVMDAVQQNAEDRIEISKNTMDRRKLVFENERTTFVPNTEENEISSEFLDSESRPRRFSPRLYVTVSDSIPLLVVPKKVPPKNTVMKNEVPKKINTVTVTNLGSTNPKISDTAEKTVLISKLEIKNKNEEKNEMKFEKEIIINVAKMRETETDNDEKGKLENMDAKERVKLDQMKLDVGQKVEIEVETNDEKEVEAKVEIEVQTKVEAKVERTEDLEEHKKDKITISSSSNDSELPTSLVITVLDQNPETKKSPGNSSKLSEIRSKQRILKKKKSQVRERNLTKTPNLNSMEENVLIDEIHEEDLKNNSRTIDTALKFEMAENSDFPIKIPLDIETEISKISNQKNNLISQKSKKNVKIKKIKDLRIRDSTISERGLSSDNQKVKELLV